MNHDSNVNLPVIYADPPSEILRRATPLARRGLHIVNDMRLKQQGLSSSVITAINPIDGAEMVWVPAGEFIMGTSEQQIAELINAYPHDLEWYIDLPECNCAKDWCQRHPIVEREWFSDETPQHLVHLDAFWMYKNPVTVAQYRTFCQTTGRQLPQTPDWGWIDDHPVVNVNWKDAQAYSLWVGATLPTEAEWEKAARGTDGRTFPWGNEWDVTKVHCSRKRVWDASQTAPVGSYPAGASPYGCLDMVGNVSEWCEDCYDENYYTDSPNVNPTCLLRSPELDDMDVHVIRGGDWTDGIPRYHSASFRTLKDDEEQQEDNIYGFRCAIRPANP